MYSGVLAAKIAHHSILDRVGEGFGIATDSVYLT